MKNPDQTNKPEPSSDGALLPYGRQSVTDDDIAAVVSVLQGDWLTTGPAVDAFEAALSEITGAEHVVSCSSGTAALHLALLAAGIGPGDSVIVPANTFLATANTARLVGAEVVFADVDPKSGQMLAEHAEAAFARADRQRIAGVMPVYFAGQCAAPAALASFAGAHGLRIIEDACHALGTSYETGADSHPVGRCDHADMATFSFHPVKTITTGEGGAITTRDADLAEKLRLFRNHGMTRDPAKLANESLAHDPSGDVNPWYYEMAEPGLNYRISDIQCALGASQLKRLPAIVKHRRALVAHYTEKLSALAPVVQPLEVVESCRAAWHLQVVRIDFAAAGLTRAEVMNRLRAQGIGSQVHYIPVPWQPYYKGRYGQTGLPGASAYYDTCLSLPLFESLTFAEVDRVVDTLESVLSGPRH